MYLPAFEVSSQDLLTIDLLERFMFNDWGYTHAITDESYDSCDNVVFCSEFRIPQLVIHQLNGMRVVADRNFIMGSFAMCSRDIQSKICKELVK